MRKILIAFLIALSPIISVAQCAMCRTQIKNNVSHGETEMAEGLNNGIMYLFFTPYLLVAVMIFLWYRYSKINEQKISIIEHLKRQMS